MHVRLLLLSLSLFMLSALCLAGEITAELFAKTPAPGPGEFDAPRVIAIDPDTSRCFVLDSGLARVTALTLDGRQTASWALHALGVSTPLPTDPLLPNPSLAVAGKSIYLLNLDRGAQEVELVVLDGPGDPRTVTLPERATNGAVALDSAGRVLVAYLQVEAGALSLVLAREGAHGKVSTLGTVDAPCDGQMKDLAFTGFVVAPDGQLAIGIAQKGAPAYSFVRSWLLQGALRDGAINRSPRVTHRFSLLTAQGNVQERYRPAVALAGRQGYPAKACVPLFTALVFGPDGAVISGGHTLDPFLRVYRKDGSLARSIPRQAIGGQHLAAFSGADGYRLFATAPAQRRVQEYALDGRVLGGFGVEAPYHLTQPLALAATREMLYIATRRETGYQLLQFAGDGSFRWAQELAPPAKMPSAQPTLAVASGDRVFIGWRLPKAAGLGWVETVMEDGTPGTPLWTEPATTLTPTTTPCPTPLLTGANGRLYVLRELKEGGLRLQAYSATGAFLQQFPATMQGITAVTDTGSLAWARAQDDGMIIVPYSAQGIAQGWKRIPRPAKNAEFLTAHAGELWGWLTSTKTLLKLDGNLMVVDELTVFDPEGNVLSDLSAVTGDGKGNIYLALPGRILVVTVN